MAAFQKFFGDPGKTPAALRIVPGAINQFVSLAGNHITPLIGTMIGALTMNAAGFGYVLADAKNKKYYSGFIKPSKVIGEPQGATPDVSQIIGTYVPAIQKLPPIPDDKVRALQYPAIVPDTETELRKLPTVMGISHLIAIYINGDKFDVVSLAESNETLGLS